MLQFWLHRLELNEHLWFSWLLWASFNPFSDEDGSTYFIELLGRVNGIEYREFLAVHDKG